jgi:GNAT superfamily N-acetyltransferase
LPEAALRDFGWKGLLASSEIDAEALGPLLVELREEDCAHSWRTALRAGSGRNPSELLPDLLASANRHRPTALFTYYAATTAGAREPVAIATVAERIRTGFPWDGFPVLARCFIRRPYRAHGIYRHLLRHRLDLCRAHWGPRLLAIHVGASDPAVEHTLINAEDLEPRFVHIGDEVLTVAGIEFRVRDFLAPTEAFRAQLEAGGGPLRLRVQAASFLQHGGWRIPYSTLRAAVARAEHEEAGPVADWNLPLAQLVALCDAIPVVT